MAAAALGCCHKAVAGLTSDLSMVPGSGADGEAGSKASSQESRAFPALLISNTSIVFTGR